MLFLTPHSTIDRLRTRSPIHSNPNWPTLKDIEHNDFITDQLDHSRDLNVSRMGHRQPLRLRIHTFTAHETFLCRSMPYQHDSSNNMYTSHPPHRAQYQDPSPTTMRTSLTGGTPAYLIQSFRRSPPCGSPRSFPKPPTGRVNRHRCLASTCGRRQRPKETSPSNFCGTGQSCSYSRGCGRLRLHN